MASADPTSALSEVNKCEGLEETDDSSSQEVIRKAEPIKTSIFLLFHFSDSRHSAEFTELPLRLNPHRENTRRKVRKTGYVTVFK